LQCTKEGKKEGEEGREGEKRDSRRCLKSFGGDGARWDEGGRRERGRVKEGGRRWRRQGEENAGGSARWDEEDQVLVWLLVIMINVDHKLLMLVL
jgi:hypothetical protein